MPEKPAENSKQLFCGFFYKASKALLPGSSKSCFQGNVYPGIALDGMPPSEYFCKKQERSNETLIGFTFS